jgi:hypothetical protein
VLPVEGDLRRGRRRTTSDVKLHGKRDGARIRGHLVWSKSDIETIQAKKPNAILALALDPVTADEAFKPAVASG